MNGDSASSKLQRLNRNLRTNRGSKCPVPHQHNNCCLRRWYWNRNLRTKKWRIEINKRKCTQITLTLSGSALACSRRSPLLTQTDRKVNRKKTLLTRSSTQTQLDLLWGTASDFDNEIRHFPNPSLSDAFCMRLVHMQPKDHMETVLGDVKNGMPNT
jgi:hypothetical protein